MIRKLSTICLIFFTIVTLFLINAPSHNFVAPAHACIPNPNGIGCAFFGCNGSACGLWSSGPKYNDPSCGGTYCRSSGPIPAPPAGGGAAPPPPGGGAGSGGIPPGSNNLGNLGGFPLSTPSPTPDPCIGANNGDGYYCARSGGAGGTSGHRYYCYWDPVAKVNKTATQDTCSCNTCSSGGDVCSGKNTCGSLPPVDSCYNMGGTCTAKSDCVGNAGASLGSIINGNCPTSAVCCKVSTSFHTGNFSSPCLDAQHGIGAGISQFGTCVYTGSCPVAGPSGQGTCGTGLVCCAPHDQGGQNTVCKDNLFTNNKIIPFTGYCTNSCLQKYSTYYSSDGVCKAGLYCCPTSTITVAAVTSPAVSKFGASPANTISIDPTVLDTRSKNCNFNTSAKTWDCTISITNTGSSTASLQASGLNSTVKFDTQSLSAGQHTLLTVTGLSCAISGTNLALSAGNTSLAIPWVCYDHTNTGVSLQPYALADPPVHKSLDATVYAFPIGQNISMNYLAKNVLGAQIHKSTDTITLTQPRNYTNPHLNLGYLPTNSYELYVHVDRYLNKKLPSLDTTNMFYILPGDAFSSAGFTLIPGDVNGDNFIDDLDYNAVLNCYKNKANTPSCKNKLLADLNDDGVVDDTDLQIVIDHYGEQGDYFSLPSSQCAIDPSCNVNSTSQLCSLICHVQ